MHTGIQLHGSAFWVVHRSRAYGPFDYEWSSDFRGVEFQYQGRKFGEYCSADELYADLREFKLPKRVYQVASISMATILKSIMDGVSEHHRADALSEQLREMGFPQFATVVSADM